LIVDSLNSDRYDGENTAIIEVNKNKVRDISSGRKMIIKQIDEIQKF
jgi:hypothetical protein